MSLPEESFEKLPEISSLLPHAGPMALLGRLVSADQEALCAEVVIGPNTLFCDGQSVGGWIGVEYMAQAIAAHAGYLARLRGGQVKVGFLLGSRRYECRRPGFALGSVLHVHVLRELQGENGLGAFACRIVDANDPAASALATATITVFQPKNVMQFVGGNNEAGV